MLFVPLFLFGCSGPPASRSLATLDLDDVRSLCEDFSSRKADLTCDGETVTVFEAEWACESDLAEVGAFCESTVGELVDCVDALEEDGCDASLGHPACVDLLDPECGLATMLHGMVDYAAFLPASTPLNDIDALLWTDVCESVIDPSEGPIECDGFTIEPSTVQDCVAGSDMPYQDGCTLGQWFECVDYEPDDPCDFTDLGPCEAFFDDCVL